MEIERKFLIDWKEIDALGLPLVKQAQSWQGYLSAATPVVRIRKRDFSDGHTDYILCIKGKGKLAREEIEKELTPQEFSALEAMLPIPMIHKDYRVYRRTDICWSAVWWTASLLMPRWSLPAWRRQRRLRCLPSCTKTSPRIRTTQCPAIGSASRSPFRLNCKKKAVLSQNFSVTGRFFDLSQKRKALRKADENAASLLRNTGEFAMIGFRQLQGAAAF